MADVSVRPALPGDAARIGAIHAHTMRLAVEAGTGAVTDIVFEPAEFARQWGAAIAAAPSPLHRVLAALEGTEVVGFAAIAPAAGDLPQDAPQAEVVALEVDPDRARAGHGSRLLAACVDILRQQNADRVLVWAVQGEDVRVRFLQSAGFAPLGVRRSFAVGSGTITQVAWHAAL